MVMAQVRDSANTDSSYSHYWLTTSDIQSKAELSANALKYAKAHSENVGDSFPSLYADSSTRVVSNKNVHSAQSKPLAAALDIMSALYPTRDNAFVSQRARKAARSYWTEAKEDHEESQKIWLGVRGSPCQTKNDTRDMVMYAGSKLYCVNKNNNAQNMLLANSLSSYNNGQCHGRRESHKQRTVKHTVNVTKPVNNRRLVKTEHLNLSVQQQGAQSEACTNGILGYQPNEINLPGIDSRCPYRPVTEPESPSHGTRNEVFTADYVMQNKSLPGAHWSVRDYTMRDKYLLENSANCMESDMPHMDYSPHMYQDQIPETVLLAKGTNCVVTNQNYVVPTKMNMNNSRVWKDLVKVRDNLTAISNALQVDRTSQKSTENRPQRKDSTAEMLQAAQLKCCQLLKEKASGDPHLSPTNADDTAFSDVEKDSERLPEKPQSPPEDDGKIDDSPIKFKTVAFQRDKHNEVTQLYPPAPPNSPRYKYPRANLTEPAIKLTYQSSPKSYVSQNVKRLMKKLLNSCPVNIASNRKPSSQFLASITHDIDAEQKVYRKHAAASNELPLGRRVLSSSETFRRDPTNHAIYNIATMRNQVLPASTNDGNIIPLTMPAKLHMKAPYHNHELCMLNKSMQKSHNKYRL